MTGYSITNYCLLKSYSFTTSMPVKVRKTAYNIFILGLLSAFCYWPFFY